MSRNYGGIAVDRIYDGFKFGLGFGCAMLAFYAIALIIILIVGGLAGLFSLFSLF